LASRIRDGDRAALERWVERHLPRVHRYVHHRLGPGHDDLAVEVVRATFSEALRKLGPYARSAVATPMEFWLLRLAERNLARQHRIPPSIDTGGAAHNSSGQDEDLAIVRAAMDTLHRRHASVLALALFEGMSSEEIAYTLGVGQAKAMRRLRLALRQIGKRLAGPQEVDS
jgi:RNA polymerase sigma-70 factor (ECF subfamily)